MSYGRIVTPRIYTCTMRHLLARGAASSCWSKIAGTLNTGSDINDLLNARPGQRVSFDTSGAASTHLILQFDMGLTETNPINFVAVLNHNMGTAGAAVPTLRYNTSAFTGPGEGTAVTPGAYPFGGVDTGVISEDGTWGMTFTGVANKRYWALEIPDDSNFTATDLEMGLVLIGSTYDFPFSPDLEITVAREFSGVRRRESEGGQGWTTASHLGGPGDASTVFGQPFRVNSTSYLRRFHARRAWDLKFSRIEDTSLSPVSGGPGLIACSTIDDVWERTCGGLLPFIFTPDNTSTNAGDSAWAYFDQDTLEPRQGPSPKVWSYGLSIREEF